MAFQQGFTPLPTVEGVLFDALAQTKLIDGDEGFDGCEWERCGRTDRGVSGAGQVVSLWVRSALEDSSPVGPEPESKSKVLPDIDGQDSGLGDDFGALDVGEEAASTAKATSSVVARKELRYIFMLNRVLPPTIRVLAWSPVSPTFSARFGCKYRHYKYFFHSRGLDISRMQDSADRLVGEHDFRNLCKLDPAKQISNFKRKILRAQISPASPVGLNNGVYVFDLVGTAFLYNQVRHIVAVLFLVGTGLEPPQIMSALLNVDKENPYPPFKDGEDAPMIVDRKPEYQMADGLPLVLWDCAYNESDIQWRVDDVDDKGDGQQQNGGDLYRQLSSIHERSVIHTTLDEYFLETAAKHHLPPPLMFPLGTSGKTKNGRTLSLPLGGGTFQRTSKYIPLLQRKRMEDVHVVNSKWRLGKGARKGVGLRK
jgi:tRNA pseudouridine38/39 synthase